MWQLLINNEGMNGTAIENFLLLSQAYRTLSMKWRVPSPSPLLLREWKGAVEWRMGSG